MSRIITDREKVSRGLDCLSKLSQDGKCNGCAYFRPFKDDPNYGWCDTTEAINDVLALLREQEPVEPHVEHDSDDDSWYYGCGACHWAIDHTDAYCRHCGRKVKWDNPIQLS